MSKTVTFLPDKFVLPCGSTAQRREHEPWFYDVKQAAGQDWSRLKDIPGVGIDGYRRVWVIPEEVIALELMK